MTSTNQKQDKADKVEKTEKVEKKEKRERVSMTESRSQLGVKVKKSVQDEYFIRWFNDVGGRVQRALDAGYEFVNAKEVEGRVGDKEVHGGNSDLNSRVSRKTKVGDDEITVFLMKQPNNFHEEDLAAKEAKNMGTDDAIRAGQSGGASVGNTYGDIRVVRR